MKHFKTSERSRHIIYLGGYKLSCMFLFSNCFRVESELVRKDWHYEIGKCASSVTFNKTRGIILTVPPVHIEFVSAGAVVKNEDNVARALIMKIARAALLLSYNT